MNEAPAEQRALRIGEAFGLGWTSLWERPGLFLAIELTMILAWIALELAVIAGQRLVARVRSAASTAAASSAGGTAAGCLSSSLSCCC